MCELALTKAQSEKRKVKSAKWKAQSEKWKRKAKARFNAPQYRNSRYNVVRLGEIGHRCCLRIQNLGTEIRQPKTKVPART